MHVRDQNTINISLSWGRWHLFTEAVKNSRPCSPTNWKKNHPQIQKPSHSPSRLYALLQYSSKLLASCKLSCSKYQFHFYYVIQLLAEDGKVSVEVSRKWITETIHKLLNLFSSTSAESWEKEEDHRPDELCCCHEPDLLSSLLTFKRNITLLVLILYLLQSFQTCNIRMIYRRLLPVKICNVCEQLKAMGFSGSWKKEEHTDLC